MNASQVWVHLIDHTQLMFAPDEDESQAITQLCTQAKAFGFYAVCVRLRHLLLAKQLLQGSNVKTAVVIGFPVSKCNLVEEQKQPTIGGFSMADKLAEIKQSVEGGADELDIVLDVGLFKQETSQNQFSQTVQSLQAFRQAAPSQLIKLIIETDLLSVSEIIKITQLCAEAQLEIVKTSTGMLIGGQGATEAHIALIQQSLKQCNAHLGIKASGGVKTVEQVLSLAALGATRIGTSNAVAMVEQSKVLNDY